MKVCEQKLALLHIKSTSEDGFRQGWRKCLEWLKENEDSYCCGDCDQVCDWLPCPTAVSIDDELNS